MDPKLQPLKGQPLSRNLLKYSKKNEISSASGEISSILNSSTTRKNNEKHALKNWQKSATVHSNMLHSQLGYTDSLVKSTAAGTMGDNVSGYGGLS